MVDWATLPLDLWICIAKGLDCLEDYIYFGAVCKSWQSAKSSFGTELTLAPRFPYVMLPDIAEKEFHENHDPGHMSIEAVKKKEQIEGMHKRGFFSFSTCKTYDIELPEATLRKCIGVGYGWLLTIRYDFQINLLYPFTRKQIVMPNFKSFGERDWTVWPNYGVHSLVKKAVMSSNQEDCVILAIYSSKGKLAIARPGDEIWTYLNSQRNYSDVIYFNGNFYAVDSFGFVYVCEINDQNNPNVTKIASTEIGDIVHKQKYLVELSGSLLVVVRHRYRCNLFGDILLNNNSDRHSSTYNTIRFSIYRLEENKIHDDNRRIPKYPYRLREIGNLGDKSLFLGTNASTSLPCSKCVKPNCIYFSEDDSEYYSNETCGGGQDTGIYDVKSKSTTKHYATGFRSHLTPPIWLV